MVEYSPQSRADQKHQLIQIIFGACLVRCLAEVEEGGVGVPWGFVAQDQTREFARPIWGNVLGQRAHGLDGSRLGGREKEAKSSDPLGMTAALADQEVQSVPIVFIGLQPIRERLRGLEFFFLTKHKITEPKVLPPGLRGISQDNVMSG
ncbi:hypothetical protein LRE06_06755 [Halorhodospira halophila]|nr:MULTISPECIES: hypothetical protein [Halorhodospira]MCG5528043.1 hypothetical protein [Halorhodospira halophila]MCG5542087.1 hypothetical protein [Halorhodospira sp. 9628]